MRHSITFKTLIILGLVISAIFICSAYLFSKNDKQLVLDIQKYNLNQAMSALDARLSERLMLNENLMDDLSSMVAKNSSSFLLNFDTDGLQKSLLFDLKKQGVQAIEIWDNDTEEFFLTALKLDGKIIFQDSVPTTFNQFIKIKKNIDTTSNGAFEQVGHIVLYYDERLIINQIKVLKTNTKQSIEKFNKAIGLQQSESNMVKLIIIISSLVAILFLVSMLLINFVSKPLKTLELGLNNFFLFLQNKKTTINKIELHTNDEFGSMAKSLNSNISVSAKLHAEINELNINLEERIEEKTTKVTSLLNNADQGFLSFSNDLIIDNEYSKECTHIFKQEILGLNIADLLYGDNHKKDFFIETLQSLLRYSSNPNNKLKIKTIISLLQHEFILNKKVIEVKYKIVADDKFMLILTDITANKILERKINREKITLKMVVAIVSESEEFFELYDDFNALIKSKNTLIDRTKTPLHNATELYRTVHTFKGLFSQKEMQHLVLNLHKLETSLSEILAGQDNSNDNLQNLLDQSDFQAWMSKDINTIKGILGDELFSKRGEVTVPEETLTQIEEKLIQLAEKNQAEEYKVVANDIRRLKNRTIHSLFNSYPKLIDQLSSRLDKPIYPLSIIVDQNIKGSDTIKPFIRSLVHVFRNSVDHGIESMDDRLEAGKDEIGTISCTINQNNTDLQIIIADDGAGLDLQKISQQAVLFGIEIEGLSDNEIEFLIFNDQFSTKDNVSEVSGRGIGMAVVRNEIEKLNGKIQLSSQKNIGTTFVFTIPI